MPRKNQSKEKPDSEVKTEAVEPLKVEIEFPSIMDLKQAIATDSDGNLIIGIQFKAKVDQFEVFRLINLLKQPHGALYATIGSPQSAMDFKFDAKQIRFETFLANKRIEAGKSKKVAKVGDAQEESAERGPTAVKIHAVAFNHIPDEEKPYGVAIDYVGDDGSGEVHTIAGRGLNPTEAVLVGVARILPEGGNEPFEVMAALEQLEPSPEGYKLIRVIQVGNFDEEGNGESEQALKGD